MASELLRTTNVAGDLPSAQQKRKEVRVWMDGSFDMVHFGHANVIRLAQQLGDKLVVGLQSDERARLVGAIKWVHQVVENAPYGTRLETLDEYNCDFCVHGDDISTTADGRDPYAAFRPVNRFRILSRSESQHREEKDHKPSNGCRSPWTGRFPFLTTSRIITQFAEGRDPRPGDRIVYVDGAYDLFNVGHVDFLEKAAAEGDFLIVGLHNDSVVRRYKGDKYPIITLLERVLSVLACKYVADVVIDAPYEVTAELLDRLKVDVEAKKRGKFKFIDSGNPLTTEMIVERIVRRRHEFEARNMKKEEKEVKILELYHSDLNV
ncbi:hypothetical protein BaRGS_00001380 [Batillaria attramentaria]|uniref:ethanolamine-phosphate cytidylyltransferase n=1 Tax=Batillaria attramentaria TaxID=370345 RepID=A0ABD0M6U6_9CAEN